jgi:hypothetical protein
MPLVISGVERKRTILAVYLQRVRKLKGQLTLQTTAATTRSIAQRAMPTLCCAVVLVVVSNSYPDNNMSHVLNSVGSSLIHQVVPQHVLFPVRQAPPSTVHCLAELCCLLITVKVRLAWPGYLMLQQAVPCWETSVSCPGYTAASLLLTKRPSK